MQEETVRDGQRVNISDLKNPSVRIGYWTISRAFINSMIMFAGVWAGNIIFGGLAGYTISRLKPKGSKKLFKPEQMLAAFIVMIPALIVFAFCSKRIMNSNLSVAVKE